MPIKPANLQYGVNEKPPVATTIILGIQHATLMLTVLIFPLLIILAAHGSTLGAMHMIQAIMLVMGIGTLALSFGKRFIGSDYFTCMIFDPSYFPVSVMAAKLGGLPMLYTIGYVQSLLQIIFSDVVVRLRKFFPVEISGLVIFMIGVSIITVGIANAIGGVDNIENLHWDSHSCIVSFVSLIAMVSCSVWGGKRLSCYGLLVGLIVGLLLSAIFHMFKHATPLPGDQVFSLPTIAGFHLSTLHWDFVIPMLVAVISVTLKAMGNLVTVEKVNDADWVRPELKKIRRGLFTTGLGSLLSTFLGGLPMGISSGNIGLSVTTHVTSRRIALPLGILFIVFSFLPTVSELFTLIPKPLLGAMIIYVISSILVAGIQVMLSRMLDTRKLFTIGLPVIIGLAFEFIPQLQHDVSPMFRPIVASPLTTSTVLAIVLNMFFQLGATKKANMDIDLKDYHNADIKNFMHKEGSLWGAMPATMYRAGKTIMDSLIAIKNIATTSNVDLTLFYDEYSLRGELTYAGPSMELDLEETIKMMTSKKKNIDALALHTAEAHADSVQILSDGDKQILRFVINQ
jgi:NCS2 family nucleobase:cation symporter-2